MKQYKGSNLGIKIKLNNLYSLDEEEMECRTRIQSGWGSLNTLRKMYIHHHPERRDPSNIYVMGYQHSQHSPFHPFKTLCPGIQNSSKWKPRHTAFGAMLVSSSYPYLWVTECKEKKIKQKNESQTATETIT